MSKANEKATSSGMEGLLRRAACSAAGTYAAYVLHGLRHPDLLRPGADAETSKRHLPGDDLIDGPQWSTTFATDIHAPATSVWPWLLQIGWGRAGWYTWYRFDNGGVPSADRIVHELQDLDVGDVIPDGPRASEGFGVWRVHELTAPHAMVLVSRREPMTGREIPATEATKTLFIDCSWTFVLEETAWNTCRLIVRVRAKIEGERFLRASLLALGVRALFGVGDTVMERTLLAGIKQRAEKAWSSQAAAVPPAAAQRA